MDWFLDELKKLAGPDAEERVKLAAKRGRQQVEPILKELTRLQLSPSGLDLARVTVEVDPGLPTHMLELNLTNDDVIAILLGTRARELKAIKHASSELVELLTMFSATDIPFWREQAQVYADTFDAARGRSNELLDRIAAGIGLRRFVDIDHDTLGIYSFRDAPRCTIKLYWAVIGAVARELDCSIEALAMVTLIHELAHAYSHLGADAERTRWDTDDFRRADPSVQEGLAQYYTHLVGRHLCRAGVRDVFTAYRRFLRWQHGPYRAHLNWILFRAYSPEVVRAALLEFRMQPDLSQKKFTDLAEQAKIRLLTSPRRSRRAQRFPV
jgi:hypothetical protein